MGTHKTLLFGNTNAGKSQLINRALETEAYNDRSGATDGARYLVKEQETTKLDIWDIGGQERFKFLRPTYFVNVSIAIYCIDLSVPLDLEVIINDMQELKNSSPFASLILVGTKSDLFKGDAYALLDSISIDGIDERIVTSAKNNKEINTLLNRIIEVAKDKDTTTNLWWEEEKTKFLDALSTLSIDEYGAIHNELVRLQTALFNSNDQDKDQAINAFTISCNEILNENHSTLLHAVISLAAVAVVTLIAGLVGFGIGFAAGAWSGPGAFISGFMAGTTAAVSVVAASASLGLITGGLSAYGLFNKSPNVHETAVDVFVEKLHQNVTR
jgi:small GTP-binding protein